MVALAAAGIFIARHQLANKPKPAPPAAAPAPEVSEVELTGRLQARTTVQVAAPFSGVVDAVFVDIEQEVYQGQLLAKIRDPKLDQSGQQAQNQADAIQARITSLGTDEIAARLEASRTSANQGRAHSELDRTQKAFERQKALWAAGATPRLSYENAEKEYANAKADVEAQDATARQAQERLEAVTKSLEEAHSAAAAQTKAIESAKTAVAAGEIHSPVDGVVISRKAQPGQMVDPAIKDLFEIATDLKTLQAIIRPEETLLPRFQAGQAAAVKIPELTPDEFPGMVSEIRDGYVIVGFTRPAPIAKLNLAAQVRIKF